MLAEFEIISDPLRPSIRTNLCSVCCRHKNTSKKIGCCSYEPEFCLFDLIFLHLYYPDIYELIMKNGRIIEGYNGIMLEMKVGLNQCPFASNQGCVLPKDAMTPLCRLYICREAAVFGPALIEERFDDYFKSKEYELNNYLNNKLIYDQNFNSTKLHDFIIEFSQPIKTMIAEIDRTKPTVETYHREINIEDFKLVL
ncbi:hypothetical protein REC12_01785 [Desulfosporosinus sp. PR]|uniref:hypothetical protein n=1 Tax=Candidatus Desulfosporosinus nitrosoreducens TaxID=3401928 RepID=UPI0027F25254|nr:hypothetical protein [Desulfosporosinus sp. PR]MDQ7092322.1 hypothetical protein [Desulfosporosinus sp. PR]